MSTNALSSTAAPTASQPTTSVFLVTSPGNETSRKIANAILSKKLAACVNLVPKITSLYVREDSTTDGANRGMCPALTLFARDRPLRYFMQWWDGKVQEDTEELMVSAQ
jgi:uncharacterized protein involved in tolerance to divalent cations